MAGRKRVDPNARRQGETHWQWRNRIAEQKELAAIKAEKKQAEKRLQEQGFSGGFIIDDDGNLQNTYRRKSRSALAYMRERGSLTDDQYGSAMEIAGVAEMLERSVASKGGSMEAKVDCSGSARDALNESLYRVRAEGAYTEWRSKLPLPRRMFIDMVTQDAGLASIAAAHNMGWPKARGLLLAALDAWPEIFAKYVKRIDEDELTRAHARLKA